MHWLSRHRFWILALICAFWTGLIFLGHFFPGTPFLSVPWGGEQSFEDLLRREGRKTPTRDDFVFLGIDQSTLQLPPMTTEEIAGNRAVPYLASRPPLEIGFGAEDELTYLIIIAGQNAVG